MHSYLPVSGGDISSAYLLSCSEGNFFLKINQNEFAETMFHAEAQGLRLLDSAKAIKIPEVVGYGLLENHAYLLLEAIQTSHPTSVSLKHLGEQLAQLHKTTNAVFGLDHSNFIGSLPQSNNFQDTWSVFYIKERLMPQYALANSKGLLQERDIPDYDQMKSCCDNLFKGIQPSLLHGDLWSGNYLIDSIGNPVLIDPAAYFGHHEVDIAMSRLFGGFGIEFYQAYEAHFPKTDGYEERMDLYQLYYLLVHLNMFGRSYYSSVIRLTKKLFSL